MYKCEVKPKQTQRKFYNKWIYKISLFLPGCHVFRYNSLESIMHNPDIVKPNWRYTLSPDTGSIKHLAEILHTTNHKWAKRIETDCIDIYTNDKDLYDTIYNELTTSVKHRFEPDIDNLDLLDKKYTTVVKKLPFNRYNYRVYLNPLKCSFDERESFIRWVDSQNGKIKMTNAVKHWFSHAIVNWDRRYILIEDKDVLLMAKLKCAKALGKVYTFEVADK